MSKLPEKIGKYSIVSLIAKGGMGAVYKGIHPTLNRHVILKKLTLKGSSAITERFKREARIMMDFKNDHIVDVYDHFKEGNSYYIVQEYVDGIALDALIKQQRYLPNDIALMIFLYACKALCYAHNKYVIHRDIKPANILLSKTGDIKLVDFGIATSEGDSDDGLTKEGMTLGTPSYMAPEQFQNTKNVDTRADIYSMGVTLYEMVSGKRPYPGTLESVALIQKGKYKPVGKINPKVSRFIRHLVGKMMQVKPKRRFQSLDKVISITQNYLRRKPVDLIKERLIQVIKGNQVAQEPRKKVSLIKKIFSFLFFLIVFGGSLILFAYTQGYHREFLQSEKFGAFRLEVKVAKQFKKSASAEIYLNAQIYEDDANLIPEVKDIHINLREFKAGETDAYYLFQSPKYYLPSGHYRWKLSAEDQVFWNSYFLNPRSIQKTTVETQREKVISFVVNAPAAHPFIFSYTVLDQLSGKSLTGVSLQYRSSTKNRWQDWDKELADSLLSGRSHYFKFSRENYYDRAFDPYLQPYMYQLHIEAALIPLPGEITVSSTTPDVNLLLDNASVYRSCTPEGKIEMISSTLEKPLLWQLAPGKHVISAGPYKGSEQKSVTIDLKSGQKVRLSVDYDKKEKKLTLQVN